MRTPPKTCIMDQDSAALLDLLEKGPRTDSVIEAERHVAECPRCAEELASLGRIDAVLRQHPEAFHPEERELYLYVTSGTDPVGAISAHLADCRDCRASVELLQDLLEIGAEVPSEIPVMPASLAERLERIHGPRNQSHGEWNLGHVVQRVRRWLRLPWRIPALAAGTVAASVLAVVMAQQMWTAVKQIEGPSEQVPVLTPASPPSKVAPEEKRTILPAAVAPSNELEEKKEAPKAQSVSPEIPRPEPFSREAGVTGTLPEPLSKGDVRQRDQPLLEFAKPPGVAAAPAPEAEKAQQRAARSRPEAPSRQPMVSANRAKPAQRDEKKRETVAAQETDALKMKASEHAMRSSGESVGRGLLIPVRVQVTDADGRPFPGLTYSGDPDLATEYLFSGMDAEDKDKAPIKTGVLLNGRVSVPREAPPKGYRIVIRVRPAGDAYDLEGRLTEVSCGKEKRVATLSGVARDHAADAVATLVRALLKRK
ncbi:MAG: hypothetical protein AB1646_02670 [Thermodesulfobacteriota bacterium]